MRYSLKLKNLPSFRLVCSFGRIIDNFVLAQMVDGLYITFSLVRKLFY